MVDSKLPKNDPNGQYYTLPLRKTAPNSRGLVEGFALRGHLTNSHYILHSRVEFSRIFWYNAGQLLNTTTYWLCVVDYLACFKG